MNSVIDTERLRNELSALGTPERAEGAKAYLKSDLEFLGVAVPDLRKTARKWLREKGEISHRDLVETVETLWREPVNEFRHLAGILLQLRSSMLKPSDLPLLQRLIRESKTWAYVDLIAIRAVGSVVERHPEAADRLDAWATHPDFWVRRSALIALLLPLRRGEGDWDRFARYADQMWREKEFFIRKAIGWVLREVSKLDADRVVRFVEPRATTASGVTMREALKYVGAADRDRLMHVYRKGEP